MTKESPETINTQEQFEQYRLKYGEERGKGYQDCLAELVPIIERIYWKPCGNGFVPNPDSRISRKLSDLFDQKHELLKAIQSLNIHNQQPPDEHKTNLQP
ncbi:hypothetical protein Q4E93_09955 [Flavitalea sp. BT771]|uniref:hypothetical protein n=1 Tax=Flavitalea sp. BT771 TaxID=3063329 RepID=UPI0026E1B43D|nr:hypothetical protein [Flavitalea sp. BT771]MDO6430911.1 hypothetical protein [Flavitalea sp. BT771]MDV6218949.1 hypothetical protein [Flavitalea sp. BT771]